MNDSKNGESSKNIALLPTALLLLSLLLFIPVVFALGFGEKQDPNLIPAPKPTQSDAAGASNAPQIVGVQVTVSTPTPQLSVAPTSTPTTTQASTQSSTASTRSQRVVEKPQSTQATQAAGAATSSASTASTGSVSSSSQNTARFVQKPGAVQLTRAFAPPAECNVFSTCGGSPDEISGQCGSNPVYSYSCTASTQGKKLTCSKTEKKNLLQCFLILCFLGIIDKSEEKTWSTGCGLSPGCSGGSVKSESPCTIETPATQYCCQASSPAPSAAFSPPTPSNEAIGRNNVTVNVSLSGPADNVVLSWAGVNESMNAANAENTSWLKTKTGVADGNYSFRVYALVPGNSSSSELKWVAVGITPASISVTPSTAALAAGDAKQFNASATNAYGVLVEAGYFTPSWTSNDSLVLSLLELSGNAAVFQAKKAGSGKARASSGSVFGEATASVQPGVLSRIEITGDTVCYANASLSYSVRPEEFMQNCTKSFAARGYDAFDNEVAISPTWATSNSERVYFVNASGASVNFRSNDQEKYGKVVLYAVYNNTVGSYEVKVVNDVPVWFAFPTPANNTNVSGGQKVYAYTRRTNDFPPKQNYFRVKVDGPEGIVYEDSLSDVCQTVWSQGPEGEDYASWCPSGCNDNTPCSPTCPCFTRHLISWNTTPYPDGFRTLRADLLDFDGLSLTMNYSARRVARVNNTGDSFTGAMWWMNPTPANNTKLEGVNRFKFATTWTSTTWSAWNPPKICWSLSVELDGGSWQSISTGEYSLSGDDYFEGYPQYGTGFLEADWNTNAFANGNYTVTASTTDCLVNTYATISRRYEVDNTALKISLVPPTPESGSVVSGVQTISATATAFNVIQIRVDGVSLETCASSPCNFNWNTSDPLQQGFDGSHSFYAVASDGVSTVYTETRSVTVDNSMPVLLSLSPADGATVSEDYVYVNAVFNENTGDCILYFDGFVYYMNGVGTANCYYNVTNLAAGTHQYFVSFADKAGNSASTGVRYVSVLGPDTTGPVISFVPPTPSNNEGVVNNWVFVNITADEPTQQALLEWNAGTNVSMTKASSYSFYYNKTGLVNGLHFFKVYAQDAKGNWAASQTRSVNVSLVSYVSSCGTISLPGTYYLSNNINISGGNCIAFAAGLSDTTLDCRGHSISGSSASGTYGIYMPSGQRNRVENCVVKSFDVGIYLASSSNSEVSNNSVNASLSYGVYLLNSQNNVIRANNVSSSSQYGVFFSSSPSNTVTDNIACYNGVYDLFTASTQSTAYKNTCGTLANPNRCYQNVATTFCRGLQTENGPQECTLYCSG